MANSNCLMNRKCPKCGQSDRFHVEAQSIFTVVDDGTDGHADVEYDDFSYADCPDCGWWGCWKQTEDANFMTQEIWDKMNATEKRQWKEQRNIVPRPACLAPYLGKRVVAICENYDEEVVFWVGVSTGWHPAYLEVESQHECGGMACSSQGYWNIREVGPKDKVVLRDAEEIAELRKKR